MWQRHLRLDRESKNEGFLSSKWLWRLGILITGIAVIAGGYFLSALENEYRHTYYPGVFVDNLPVSKLTPDEAKVKVQQAFDIARESQNISVSTSTPSGEVSIASSAAALALEIQSQTALAEAFTIGHNDPWWHRWQRLLSSSPERRGFFSTKTVDDVRVQNLVSALKQKLNVTGEEPKATLGSSGNPATVKIVRGKIGLALDEQETARRIVNTITTPNSVSEMMTVAAAVNTSARELNDDEVAAALERTKKLVGKKIIWETVATDDRVVANHDKILGEITDKELVALLSFPVDFSKSHLTAVVEKIQKRVDRSAQEPQLDLDQKTLIVRSFVPPRNGLALHVEKSTQLLLNALTEIEKNDDKSIKVHLPIEVSAPTRALADTNTLGIDEAIGFGESFYAHSIPNRVHNVSLTAAKINNTIVKPGEEFSFNQTLGDVSAETGFRQAYVIRNGRTELGDGGGVCQVSTTVFRAALDAGFPITRRIPHSYRVSYYELNAKPGIDATVYAGNTDLRFRNDTDHAVLIHTTADSKNLHMTVEIFGTSDGRTTEIVEHKTWGLIPAPPPLYQDDPTLPQGTIKQVDFAAAGIDASFKNVVKDRKGKVLRTDQFSSHYKPWQAVFLRGTQPR